MPPYGELDAIAVRRITELITKRVSSGPRAPALRFARSGTAACVIADANYAAAA
jgi:hypothetical protein